MKKMMILTAVLFAFASCQKEEIQPLVEPSNDPDTVPTIQYEALGLGHSIVDLEKGEDQHYTVYIYHFLDTDQASGELIVERSTGETITFTFEPKDIQALYIAEQNLTQYYLERTIVLTYDELLNTNGWFNTTLNLEQSTGFISNVNFFNGAVAQRSELPTYCGIDPVTTAFQTDQLTGSFWLDFSGLTVTDEVAANVE